MSFHQFDQRSSMWNIASFNYLKHGVTQFSFAKSVWLANFIRIFRVFAWAYFIQEWGTTLLFYTVADSWRHKHWLEPSSCSISRYVDISLSPTALQPLLLDALKLRILDRSITYCSATESWSVSYLLEYTKNVLFKKIFGTHWGSSWLENWKSVSGPKKTNGTTSPLCVSFRRKVG